MNPLRFLLLAGICLTLAACARATPTPLTVEPPAAVAARAEARRDRVETLDRAGRRSPLAPLQERNLAVGEGVDVDATGSAILKFADLLLVEVLRDGELQVRRFVQDDSSALIDFNVATGVVVGDFNPQQAINRRLTITTDFVRVDVAGTRFLLARERETPLWWVVGLEAQADHLQVTTAGVTKTVLTNQARWMAPIGEPSAGIAAAMENVQRWLETARAGGEQPELGEVLWPQADVIATTQPLEALPSADQPFTLEGVVLTLDPEGLFGTPYYALEDCNGDGSRDIAMVGGRLHFDFRPVPARVRALDVTLWNRSGPGQGRLLVFDPAREPMNQQPVTVGAGQAEVLSLRSAPGRPYHYATLELADGCFLGFSLTPPQADGRPGPPRPAVIMAQPTSTPTPEAIPTPTFTPTPKPTATPTSTPTPPDIRPKEQGLMEALPIAGIGGYDVDIVLDGSFQDWLTLADLSGVPATPIEHIVFDRNCQARFSPDFGPEDDLAAAVWFAYDKEYLYTAFVVRDEGFVPYTGPDLRFFRGDAPQLLLDIDLKGDYYDAGLNDDDWQIDFHPGLPQQDLPPRAVLWQLRDQKPRELTEAVVAVGPHPYQGVGYFLEAAVPWQALGVAPAPGLALGLVAAVSDNDTPQTNVQECMIATSPKRNWRDPTTWGTLILQSRPLSRLTLIVPRLTLLPPLPLITPTPPGLR
jgi:hypothetical protein